MQRHGRSIRYGVVLAVLVVVALPRFGAAQVLPLLSERDGDAIAFWWSQPEAPPLTAMDRVLLQMSEIRLIDPEAVEPSPRVSRVHQVPDPPSSSILSLGRLYGASHVLVGALELGRIEETAGGVGRVATATLTYRLVTVDTEVTPIDITRTFVGIASSELDAHDDIRRQVSSHLGLRLSVALSGAAALEDEAPTAPTLLVRDLETATPLVALMGELRARSTVVADLQEIWATEGTVAVRIALQPGLPLSALEAVLRELGGVADWDYELVVIGTEGMAFDVRIEPVVEAPPTEL